MNLKMFCSAAFDPYTEFSPLKNDQNNVFVLLFQFFRSFPGPPDVTEADMTLLVQKYRDPDRPGLLNYLNLHHDIVAIGEQVSRNKELIEGPTTHVDQTPVIVCDVPLFRQVIVFYLNTTLQVLSIQMAKRFSLELYH